MERTAGEKLLGLLGLARRSRQLAMGYSAVEKMVQRGENPLVIVATDMGASQKSKVERWQPIRGLVDHLVSGEDLARTLGRDKLSIVAVSESGFVKGIRRLVEQDTDK